MRINEIFYSLQGEGNFTGTPAVFIRFSGCNMRCSFCDTKHESFKEMTEEEYENLVMSNEVVKLDDTSNNGKLLGIQVDLKYE